MSLWDRLYGPAIGALSALTLLGAVVLFLRMRDLNPPMEIILPTSTPIETPLPTPTAKGFLININTASQALLETLPGIGEVRAKRIVEYRNQHGPFQSPKDLVEEKLIPVSVYEQIKDRLTVN